MGRKWWFLESVLPFNRQINLNLKCSIIDLSQKKLFPHILLFYYIILLKSLMKHNLSREKEIHFHPISCLRLTQLPSSHQSHFSSWINGNSIYFQFQKLIFLFDAVESILKAFEKMFAFDWTRSPSINNFEALKRNVVHLQQARDLYIVLKLQKIKNFPSRFSFLVFSTFHTQKIN